MPSVRIFPASPCCCKHRQTPSFKRCVIEVREAATAGTPPQQGRHTGLGRTHGLISCCHASASCGRRTGPKAAASIRSTRKPLQAHQLEALRDQSMITHELLQRDESGIRPQNLGRPCVRRFVSGRGKVRTISRDVTIWTTFSLDVGR
jgi:hypothetical protein